MNTSNFRPQNRRFEMENTAPHGSDWAKVVTAYERAYMADYYEVRTMNFRGHSYKVRGNPSQLSHPSFFSFEDEAVVREAWWNVKEGDVVFDVGAAYGSYALTALACGAAHAYCWAPEESRPLRYNLWENGFEGRSTVFEDGVWSRRGILALRDGPVVPVLCQSRDEAVNIISSHSGTCTVFHVRSLDDIVPGLKLERLDWLKFDVEGAEAECLAGAVKTIGAFRPKILVENHLFKDVDLQRKCALILRDLGYLNAETRPYHAISHSLYLP